MSDIDNTETDRCPTSIMIDVGHRSYSFRSYLYLLRLFWVRRVAIINLMFMEVLFPFYIFVFLFGLSVGSFLNALIHRLQTGESVFTEHGNTKTRKQGLTRSYCPKCRHKLSWQDLIPLLSFVLLRGHCRYCLQPISLQYPLVELATGLIFAALLYSQLNISDGRFWMLDAQALAFWFWHLFYWFFIAAALIVIFVYDLKHYLIPDKIIYPAISVVFINRLLESFSPHYWTQFGIQNLEFSIWNLEFVWDLEFVTWNFSRLLNPLLVGSAAAAFFLVVFLGSRGRWMGLGDVKLAFLMGLFLGFPNIVTALFLAFTLGAAAGIVLVLAKRKTMKSEVPFGPFLVIGTFLALFWGQQIIDWYFGLFL